MLLAIPGDVSYSNYQEATRAFWRGTVLPLATRIADGLSSWLAAPHGLVIRIDTVDALAPERDALAKARHAGMAPSDHAWRAHRQWPHG